ncbi:MAG: organoarsenical effux MFS transporter ArsJ [Granulosicoccus sp.]|nr:organoarsenical effux MFS transporter ArsJ [Granulosicoccus sp.]
MQTDIRSYLVVTAGYWAFTVTDGALRMLVVLFFHQLGYTPFEIAMLFLFYEFFGVVTNLVGGWLGTRIGLNRTMHIGMAMQVVALAMLAIDPQFLTVIYVMCAQALSGIAKDLNKMSAKASVKLLLPGADQNAQLFKWVAILTGSKNSLKGCGFFVGGALLYTVGFQSAVLVLALLLLVVLACTWILLPQELGKTKVKQKFSRVFSPSRAINLLSAARFFLFGARDVWFVVALPVFLAGILEWSYLQVGSFLACWVIAYGVVQSFAPKLLGSNRSGRSALVLVLALAFIPGGIALAMSNLSSTAAVLIIGLAIFGIVFALNSAVHSYLAVAWSDREKVAMNVGFYYMANAGGRLIGTVLSGWSYQSLGLQGSLWISTGMLALATVISLAFPQNAS